jgi:cell division protein FtsQ
MVKKILSIVLWVVTAAALVVLFIFARENYLSTPLKSVNLIPASDSGFVRRSVLHDEIEKAYGNAKVGTVDMIKIQKGLDANPWIESNTAYVDLDGNLNISFKEYEPAFRVFDKNGHSAYITQEGMVVPACSNYTPYVLIASGNFRLDNDTSAFQLCDTLDRDRNLLNALHWFKAIEGNPFAKNCIGQLYCNKRNEFELTVRGLEARVIVGDTCLAPDKLKRLEIFMKQRIDSPETQILKSINLNYKNQIVCTKR